MRRKKRGGKEKVSGPSHRARSIDSSNVKRTCFRIKVTFMVYTFATAKWRDNGKVWRTKELLPF